MFEVELGEKYCLVWASGILDIIFSSQSVILYQIFTFIPTH